MVVIVASLALGKSTLKVSRLHLHGTDAVETGAYLTRFPGFRTHVKRELPIFWRAGQGSLRVLSAFAESASPSSSARGVKSKWAPTVYVRH